MAGAGRLPLLVALVLVAAPTAGAAPWLGEATLLTPAEVTPAPPAIGDGFIAWIDTRRGPDDVYVNIAGEEFALTREERPDTGNRGAVAHGPLVAWERHRIAGSLPGEVTGKLNTDYVVYDLHRQAEIFDAGTPDANETQVSLAPGHIAYLSDRSGQWQVQWATTSGPQAFKENAAGPSEWLQTRPAAGARGVAYLEHQEHGTWLKYAPYGGEPRTLVPAVEGTGISDPFIDGERVVWTAYSGGLSSIFVAPLDAPDESIAFHGPQGQAFRRPQVDGDVLVVEAFRPGEPRQVLAACLSHRDGLHVVQEGALAPAASDGRMAYLELQAGALFAFARPIDCDGPPLDGRATSAGGILPAALILLAAGTIARWSRYAGYRRH